MLKEIKLHLKGASILHENSILHFFRCNLCFIIHVYKEFNLSKKQ